MPAFLLPIALWLKTKFGGLLGTALWFVLEKLFGFAMVKIKDFLYWRKREKAQEEALEKVDQDVEDGKPRDDETRKREEEWLNS